MVFKTFFMMEGAAQILKQALFVASGLLVAGFIITILYKPPAPKSAR